MLTYSTCIAICVCIPVSLAPPAYSTSELSQILNHTTITRQSCLSILTMYTWPLMPALFARSMCYHS
jgi:hypothetical protein